MRGIIIAGCVITVTLVSGCAASTEPEGTDGTESSDSAIALPNPGTGGGASTSGPTGRAGPGFTCAAPNFVEGNECIAPVKVCPNCYGFAHPILYQCTTIYPVLRCDPYGHCQCWSN